MSSAAIEYHVERPEFPSQSRMTDRLSTCLACGSPMAQCLVRAASPRCHDCRDTHAPLRADLVEPILRLVPPLELGQEHERQAA
jgi:hypothetical protein